MKKSWKMWEIDDCPECGSMPEVLTESTKLNFAYDGDEARCPECDAKGCVSVFGDGGATISWND